jgi:hypothetical protein
MDVSTPGQTTAPPLVGRNDERFLKFIVYYSDKVGPLAVEIVSAMPSKT